LADLWLHASQPVSQRGILKQAEDAPVCAAICLLKREQKF
jgi:hypothetical protein